MAKWLDYHSAPALQQNLKIAAPKRVDSKIVDLNTRLHQQMLRRRTTMSTTTSAATAITQSADPCGQALIAHLSEEICRALHNHEFELHYQPQINANTGTTLGAEALIRWVHPQFGLLAPGRFLPLLEAQPELLDALDHWVINAVCDFIARCQARAITLPRLALNLSARQLQNPALAGQIVGILDTTGCRIQPGQLCVEITEQSVMPDLETAGRILSELQVMGICSAVDDFGTGYCSMSYLAQLPVSYLKIDRLFITNALSNHKMRIIIKSIVSMAEAMGLRTITEGVETIEQLVLTLSLGCEEIQGYLFSRPVPEAEFLSLLQKKASVGPVNWGFQQLV